MSYKQLVFAAAGAFVLAATSALAQKTPADIPVETFFKREQYSNMVLAPNGKRLAASVPVKGRANLVVIDLDKRTRKIITGFEDNDVAAIQWINNDRICFRAADGQDASGQFNLLGTYCVDHDGENPRNFTKLGVSADSEGTFTQINFVALTRDGSPDVFASIALRSRSSFDVYRFNTMTGKYQLLTYDTPGFVRRWVLDRNNVPRIAISQPPLEKDGRTREVWYRDGADAKWELIAKSEMVASTIPVSGDMMQPFGFDGDNKTFLMASADGRDKAAIYRFDPKTKKRELVLESPLVDLDPNWGTAAIYSWPQKKYVGIRYEADKPTVKWFDPELEKLQKMVDVTFPKTYNRIELASDSDDRALIHAESDVQPAIYHLLDRKKPSVEMVAQTRDWIDPDLMAERRFVQYKARDGLLIPAWLTVPKGSAGKKLPLIVNIHGGPWVRAYGAVEWGRWPEAQFFASRGYAVLEPEPRGSAGFGKHHLTVSFKQWGQTMQDDITDGAMHLVKEGIVDEKRMCLHGGSYGGYATAMGLVKDPELWRCGAPFVAVTDLSTFQNYTGSDMSRFTDFFQNSFKIAVGDSSADRDMFNRYSPALHADRIKVPVLLAMGSEDIRVPLTHGNALRDAIQRAGGQVEFVVYNNEGHGFNKDENVFDFYKRLERFYARNLKQ
jgi:dipeptidyl aminopeptidase/acylaminoacyl peptidase